MAEVSWDTGGSAPDRSLSITPPASSGPAVQWDAPSALPGGVRPETNPAPGPVAPGPDLIGRAKAAILAPLGGGDIPRAPTGAPAGDVRDPNFLRSSLGTIGHVLLPGSWEDLAVQAAMGIPGSGIPSNVLRTAAATGAPAAIAAMKGGDPAEAALKGGLAGITGGLTGGAARAGTRGVAAATARDMPRIAQTVGAIIPEFAGANARETLARIVGGEGRAALQASFDRAENAVVRQMPGYVRVPALNDLGVMGPDPARPFLFRPDDALRAMKDARSALYSRSTGDFTGSVRDADALRRARIEFDAHIPTAAMPDYTAARAHYSRGMEILRLFNAGTEHTSTPQMRRLVPADNAQRGQVDLPQLQTSFQTQQADLAERLSPAQFEALRRAFRYDPLRRDVPGGAPSIGISSFGSIPHPYAHGWFRMPRRTGGSETAAGIAAGAGRQLGAGGADEAMK